MNRIRTLVVDDSALVRSLLSEILSGDPEIEVVGTACDPYVARDKIKQLKPDVLTLDVEMPRMDGLTFLENLMRLHPLPVLMVSSLTERGAEITLQALELGAVDFVTKPKIDVSHGLHEYAEELRAKLKAVARARPRGPAGARPAAAVPARRSTPFRTTERLIAIGASTGGTEAIKVVLEQMPPDAPAIVITQHIPAAFSAPFAERMNRSSAMSVCEAADGQLIVPGHAYIAPGGLHLTVVRDGARYVCRLTDAAPENRHRPSVDVLFRSVAKNAGSNAVAAILTGMGDDGARGLLELRKAGAHTLVQDEASSVVWGMPGSAVRLQAPEQVLPLDRIAGQLLAWTQ
ncbi:chemotaxis response regulator protein-glutamate methylesterase [Solimonas fluminis]|uniref:Protein-glutamate methylesterase/protein-glutamine glutaminase n=1 Tax=Solimonas fluminis TaxID=2086571 RepID=A0A2S5TGH3_9GAMM|nr:chemotaxis response regulator protein-glutamate methylesterase [Solimonas fluminis]PPE74065.1 chemotaxis response regulator protein-glutamate methylesterase [Solimonas fluminis]